LQAFAFPGQTSSFLREPGAFLSLGLRTSFRPFPCILASQFLLLPRQSLMPLAFGSVFQRHTALAGLSVSLESQRALGDRREGLPACLGDLVVALHLHECVECLHRELVLAGLVLVVVVLVPVFHLFLLHGLSAASS